MKIRDPRTIRRVAAAAAWLARFWIRSLRYAYRPLTRYLAPDRPELLGGARYIYAFWHEHLFLPGYLYAGPETAVLIGQHADGELIAQVVQRLGLSVVRGSSTRGGTAAVLKLLREGSQYRHLAITPDGPRGPRRICQLGAVYLASRSGLPIVPAGLGFSRCWRAGSWDRLAVPRPLSIVRAVSAHPIIVPPDLGTAELEPFRQAVENAMNHATAIAEHWARTGNFDPLGYCPPPGTDLEPKHWKAWSSKRMVPRNSP